MTAREGEGRCERTPCDRDRATPGRPMSPTKAMPWDLRRVVHLHRRAGFAATWDELQRDLKDGPEASIDRLLEGKSRSCGVPADFAAFADRLADRALAAPELQSPQGLVGLPHALRPGPADRAAHAHVARPLRHQQRSRSTTWR